LFELGADYSGVGFRGQMPYKAGTNPKSRRCELVIEKDTRMELIILTLRYVTLHENDICLLHFLGAMCLLSKEH